MSKALKLTDIKGYQHFVGARDRIDHPLVETGIHVIVRPT